MAKVFLSYRRADGVASGARSLIYQKLQEHYGSKSVFMDVSFESLKTDGVWNNPDNTAQTLKDGWLHGGDVAACDSDGFFTFHERIHEFVIYGESNVSPHEIEDVIDSHPDVEAGCVVGVPDPHLGAVLEAHAQWEENGTRLEPDELKAWLSERLVAYKVPDCWHSMKELPKTATGKIDRKALHQKGEAAQSAC